MSTLLIGIVSLSILTICCFTQEQNFETKKLSSGEYSYWYDNGFSSKMESGGFNAEGNYVVNGEYQFYYQGKKFVVTYVADEKGYHPEITIVGEVATQGLAGPSAAIVASLLGR